MTVTTVPEQATLGQTDGYQLELATTLKRCLITHNRVDFERLNLRYIAENKRNFGIIVVLQKNAYKVAQRIGILINALVAHKIENQLFYA